MAKEAVREKNSVLYEIARPLFWILFHTLLPVKYYGQEKMNHLEGSAVLISNHLHALDPAVLAFTVKHEQCVFLGKKELGQNKLTKWLMDTMHCILVDRHNTDMEAMRACMKALRMGKKLIIFPEGTRHHEGQMQQIENGTSLIVLRGRAPLVPIYLDRPLRLFRRVHAYIGDPIAYEDLLSKGINTDTCEELNQRMRDTFQDMIRAADKHS